MGKTTRNPVQTAGPNVLTCTPLPWVLEIISCALAILALAAIIATVGVYDGRTLPNWPHPISINAMISIFTAVFKASLIMPIAEGISQLKWYWFDEPRPLIDLDRFDAASRGPWGSLRLIFDFRKHYIATLGAFITVAALAVDPFSQQIIQYYDCMQPDPGSVALIPRTNRYSVGGMHTGAGSASLDGPMQVAVYMGLLDPAQNSSQLTSVDCSTGNCTFPTDNGATFSTLAMCYSCTDITDTISVNDTTVPTNWTLDSGAWVGEQRLSSIVRSQDGEEDTVFAFDALMLNYPSSCDETSRQGTSSGGCSYPEDPFAARCSVRPCVQTYGANVTRSVYSETIVSSQMLDYAVGNTYYWVLATNSTLENGTWRSCNATTSPTSSNIMGITVNGTLPGKNEIPSLYYPESCIWMYNYSAAHPLRQFLDGMFHDNVLQFYAVPSSSIGDLWIENLYRNGTANISTMNDYMEGLTLSMTANVRERGETQRSGYATGTPLASKTCIRVRWPWIALPAALMLLALCFLGVLLLQSAAYANGQLLSGQSTWKSSVLVPLFHGFKQTTLERARTPAGLTDDLSPPAISGQDMQNIARHMRVQLREDGSGLKFVDADAGKGEDAFCERLAPSFDGSHAQRDTLMAPNTDSHDVNHAPRPLSWMSHRSISPPI